MFSHSLDKVFKPLRRLNCPGSGLHCCLGYRLVLTSTLFKSWVGRLWLLALCISSNVQQLGWEVVVVGSLHRL